MNQRIGVEINLIVMKLKSMKIELINYLIEIDP